MFSPLIKTNLIQRIAAGFQGEERKSPFREKKNTIKQAAPQKVNLLVDIQARLQKAKSPSYERWARGFNLKEMAKTFSYLREHDLLDSSNDRIFFFNRENCFVKGKNNVKTKTCSRAADNGNILDKINAPFTVLEMVKGAHLPCPAETKHREIIELGRFAGKVQRRFTHGFQHLPGHG